MITLARSRISSATSLSCAGLWHRTTASAWSATYAFDPGASPPTCSARICARPWSTSATSTGSPQPRASAVAMFPAPMSPIFIAGEAYGPRQLRPGGEKRAVQGRRVEGLRQQVETRGRRNATLCSRLGLVEEALFDEPGALFSRDLDVARREQEHLVGYPLHAAVERV